MNIKPLGMRVLVKPIEAEEKTKSGIYIPDSAKEKPVQAKVVAVGDGKDMTLKVGDVVIYETYGGHEVKVNGEKHMILEFKDILAKVE